MHKHDIQKLERAQATLERAIIAVDEVHKANGAANTESPMSSSLERALMNAMGFANTARMALQEAIKLAR